MFLNLIYLILIGISPAMALEWAPGEVLVKLSPEVLSLEKSGEMVLDSNSEKALTQAGSISYSPVFSTSPGKKRCHLDRWITVECKPGVSETYVLEQVEKLSFVEKASLNYVVYLDDVPNDPDYNKQWAWQMLRAEDGWDLVHGSPSVVVAIIDSGTDLDHEDLADNIWTNTAEIPDNGVDDDANGYIDDNMGWDFHGEDNDPNPVGADNDHGTHVAGIVGAISNNDVGVAGGAWNCPVMILKVFPNNGGGALVNDVAEAVRYAADNGASVANLSLGGTGNPPIQEEAILYAYNAGVVVLASAGNGGNDGIGDSTPHYPSGNVGAIGVGSTNRFDEKDGSSNYGESWVDIFSPGVAIRAPLPNDSYGNNSGTSMASPVAAALAALIVVQNPGITPDEVEMRMEKACEPINLSNPSFYGELDPGRINYYYSLAQNPVIEVEKVIVNDASGNGNFEADSGETVTLELHMKNKSWMDGTNINVTVVAGSGVSMNDATSSYGSMASQEVKTNMDTISLTVNSHSQMMVEMTVNITADGGYSDSTTFELSINNPTPQLPGFPVPSWGGHNASVRTADFDNDGDLEIVTVSNDGTVSLFHHDGTYHPGWPINLLGIQEFDQLLVLAPPAIVDMDMDGDLEIIIADQHTDTEWINPNRPENGTKTKIEGRIHVFNHDATYLSGWPWVTQLNWEDPPKQAGFKAGPCIADIAGDDHYEIIAGNYGDHVFAWDYQGNIVSGWPRNLQVDIFATASAFDYDGDNKDEVVVATKADEEPLNSGAIYMFDGDGTQMPGFPVAWNNQIYGVPALADMDGDAIPEIIFGFGDYANEFEPNGIMVMDMRSGALEGWPVTLTDSIYSAPAIGDLDSDGDLEIVVTSVNADMYAYHHDGTPVTGFPVTVHSDPEAGINSSPTIGDLDNDGTPEICVCVEVGFQTSASLHIFAANGTEKSYSPIALVDSGFSTPTLSDVDNDGDIEILVADSTVSVFNLNTPYDMNQQYWPTYHGNNMGNGLYGMDAPLSTGINLMITDPMFTAGESFVLDAVVTNGEQTQYDSADVYIILDVYGMYWFYPSWSEAADWMDIDPLAPGSSLINVFTFDWPAGIAGGAENLFFWAGMIDDQFQLLGDIDYVSFGYSD